MQHVLSHHLATNDIAGDTDLHHHGRLRWHPDAKRIQSFTGCRNLAYHLSAFLFACFILAIIHPLNKFVIPVRSY